MCRKYSDYTQQYGMPGSYHHYETLPPPPTFQSPDPSVWHQVCSNKSLRNYHNLRNPRRSKIPPTQFPAKFSNSLLGTWKIDIRHAGLLSGEPPSQLLLPSCPLAAPARGGADRTAHDTRNTPCRIPGADKSCGQCH